MYPGASEVAVSNTWGAIQVFDLYLYLSPYESWTGDCEATRSRPIGLAETRGNGYVFTDTRRSRRRGMEG